MNKKNLALFCVLASLVLIAYFIKGPLQDTREKLFATKNFLAGLNVDTVNRIEVSDPRGNVTLVKNGDKWLIDGTKSFYVADNVIDPALQGLKDAQAAKMELAGQSAANKGEFNTDEENGTLLKLSEEDRVAAELIIGKNGQDYLSTFLSRPGDDKTYQVAVNLRSLWQRSDWYDLTIFDVDKEQIDYLRFQFPNSEFTLQKKDGVWSGTAPYSFSVDQEKAGDILDKLSLLRATEVPEQTFAGTGLEKNRMIVQMKGGDIDQTLMVGDANDQDEYFAKRADSDNIYLVAASIHDALDKEIKDLR